MDGRRLLDYALRAQFRGERRVELSADLALRAVASTNRLTTAIGSTS